MNRKLWLLALVGILVLRTSPVLADDGFYVVAVGSGVGTKITSLPYTISNPGFYYLGTNLSISGGPAAITVNADNVTIDLMGFCLSGNVTSGIYMYGRENVEIRNGTLKGFSYCILEDNTLGVNHRVISVRVKSNNFGIVLAGTGHLVQSCTASDSSYQGIRGYGGTMLRGNVIRNCGYGIYYASGGGSIIGNTVISNSGQTGIYLEGGGPFMLDQNTVVGAGTHFTPNTASYVKGTNGGF